MNPHRLLGVALCSLASGTAVYVALCGVGAPARAERVEHAAPAADTDFLKEFKRLSAANNKADMQKLMRSRVDEAVLDIVSVCEQIAAQTSEELEKLAAELQETWKATFKTEFAERVYKYFSTLEPAQKKNRETLKKVYDKALTQFENNVEKKDDSTYDLIFAQLRDHPDYFDQEKDYFYASQSAVLVARCLDEVLRKSGADQHGAWKYYVKALELREKIDLKDPVFDECNKRRAALAAKGFDKKADPAAPQEPGAGGGGAEAPKVADLGAPLKVNLAFEVVTLEQFQRPVYAADEIFSVWQGLNLKKSEGNRATIPSLPGSPMVLRVGAADVRVDLDGDGTGDEKVPLTGNITPVKVTVGKGASARPWAFLAVTGGNNEAYQGVNLNYTPSGDMMTLFYYAAASVVGDVGGTSLRVIDETLDGTYGSRPQNMGEFGLSKDVFAPAPDTLVVGTSKRARPYSEYTDVDGKWFRLAVSGDGKELTATPAQPDTGILKLDFKGSLVPPESIVVQGKGAYENSYFDVLQNGDKGVAVPVGGYQLSYGIIRKGKKKQIQKCLILPGKSPASWTVTKGSTTVVELGAPFTFDFHTKKDGEKVTVEGASVRVVGKAGERYERNWNCVPHPEVAWRKKGTKKASKPEKMSLCIDTEMMNKEGAAPFWSPLDLVLDAKGSGGDVELQLIDKKNEFFGKFESEWKE